MKSQQKDLSEPTVKCRVRNQFPLHLVRGKKKEIYEHNDIVWLTPDEAKKHEHLIEVVE